MRLSVLPNADTPAYRQIYEQIAAAILSGELSHGEAIPPIRTVAKELGVSVITVRGAWDALEADGFIETRTGSGCYVRVLTPEERDRLRSDAIQAPLTALIRTAKRYGYSEPELEHAVKDAWKTE